MFKISIVMATTALFAGLLIADRHESLSIPSSGRTAAAVKPQPEPVVIAQADPFSPFWATPVSHENPSVSLPSAAQANAAGKPKAANPAGASAHLHLASSVKEKTVIRKRYLHHPVRLARTFHIAHRAVHRA
jgi:hypothetical protein